MEKENDQASTHRAGSAHDSGHPRTSFAQPITHTEIEKISETFSTSRPYARTNSTSKPLPVRW